MKIKSGKTLSRREFLAASAAAGATLLLTGKLSAATNRQAHLHDPAHQRSSLELDRDGSSHRLHAVHTQRRHDQRRLRATGHADRQTQGAQTKARC